MTLGLEETAGLAGGYAWRESQLFEIVGRWVATTREPSAKLMFDRHSQHHAWRSRQWWDRLPVLSDVDRESLVRPLSPADPVTMEALAQLDGTVERLAGAYRVLLPRLAGAYERYRTLTGPAGDGATIWMLGLLAADIGADWREGEVLLQELVVDSKVARLAADTVAQLEGLLVELPGTL
jgi:hypothetical protein